MPKEKLLRIINNNKGDTKSLFKSKKKKPKKVFISQQDSFFNLKREKIKKNLKKAAKKNLFKSKIKKVKKIL